MTIATKTKTPMKRPPVRSIGFDDGDVEIGEFSSGEGDVEGLRMSSAGDGIVGEYIGEGDGFGGKQSLGDPPAFAAGASPTKDEATKVIQK